MKKPKNVYIDTNRNRLVFVSSVKYASNKVLKVVIEPNQNVRKKIQCLDFDWCSEQREYE